MREDRQFKRIYSELFSGTDLPGFKAIGGCFRKIWKRATDFLADSAEKVLRKQVSGVILGPDGGKSI
jgi:hypothetical protein